MGYEWGPGVFVAKLGCPGNAGTVTGRTGGFINLLACFEYFGCVGINQFKARNWLDAHGNGFGSLGIGPRADDIAGDNQTNQQEDNEYGNDKGQHYGNNKLFRRFDGAFVDGAFVGFFGMVFCVVHSRVLRIREPRRAGPKFEAVSFIPVSGHS